jgi:hypothetical protein
VRDTSSRSRSPSPPWSPPGIALALVTPTRPLSASRSHARPRQRGAWSPAGGPVAKVRACTDQVHGMGLLVCFLK